MATITEQQLTDAGFRRIDAAEASKRLQLWSGPETPSGGINVTILWDRDSGRKRQWTEGLTTDGTIKALAGLLLTLEKLITELPVEVLPLVVKQQCAVILAEACTDN